FLAPHVADRSPGRHHGPPPAALGLRAEPGPCEDPADQRRQRPDRRTATRQVVAAQPSVREVRAIPRRRPPRRRAQLAPRAVAPRAARPLTRPTAAPRAARPLTLPTATTGRQRRQVMLRIATAASSAATAAVKPLSSLDVGKPARSIACSSVSTVSTPWAT